MFKPKYRITPELALTLMRIEALRQEIDGLPITPKVLASLCETARLESTHYSTMIEGNRLTQEQVQEVIIDHARFASRERDEKEVLGYYVALEWVESQAKKDISITQKMIQIIHALVMGGGKKNVKPSIYRDGQNVIRDSRTGKIVYLPPEAHDVPSLMHNFADWIENSQKKRIPCPIRAAIAHYQLATIHPYWDGNGRTARLLATLILHLDGYGLKGIYSLDEYYAQDLNAYYAALTIGAHNYYLGRADEDITSWIEYFCDGMIQSFESVKNQALHAQKRGEGDESVLLKQLDPRQRKVITLFNTQSTITTHDVAQLLALKPRTTRALIQKWVQEGFLDVATQSKKTRSYYLGEKYRF